MDDRMDVTQIETLVCERARLRIGDALMHANLLAPRSTVELKAWVDKITGFLALEIVAQMPAVLSERVIITERWPEDWWQAFKQRWAPRWFLRRYPVKWREINVDRPLYAAVCPHVECREPGPHLQWMLIKKEECSERP